MLDKRADMYPIRDFLHLNVENAPSGWYDLDGLDYNQADDGSLILFFRLGYVYDIYVLKIFTTTPAEWELWHEDSAVVHVSASIIAKNPAFQCEILSTPCDMPFEQQIHGKDLKTRATRFRFEASDKPFGFQMRFDLHSGKSVLFTNRGWVREETIKKD